MEFIDFVALAGLLISAWIYIALAQANKRHSVSSFFYNSHKTKSKRYGASMAAASTSLATVILFFITGVGNYGVFLLWCGITYFIGQALLLWCMKKSQINTSNLTTIADFWAQNTSTNITPKIISLLTITAFVFMLFLELYIGSEILTYFIGTNSPISSFICYLLLLLLVITYVLKGGMHAVLKSDLWQYSLMVISIIAIGFCSVIYFSEANYSSQNNNLTTLKVENFELSLFLIWVTIQNLTLPFTQLSSWQRLASMENVESAIRGLKSILLGFLILWLVPVLALLALKSVGAEFSNIRDFFDFFRESESMIIYFSFALIFVGFSSALFSTADSAFMAAMLAVVDKNTFLQAFNSASEIRKRNLILSFAVILILIEGGLFFVFKSQADKSYLSVVYVIFSQLSLLAPHMLYVMYRLFKALPSKSLSRFQDAFISLGLLFSWLVLFYFNFYGSRWGLNQNNSIILGSLIGITISGFSLLVTLSLKPRLTFMENNNV